MKTYLGLNKTTKFFLGFIIPASLVPSTLVYLLPIGTLYFLKQRTPLTNAHNGDGTVDETIFRIHEDVAKTECK